MFTKLSEMTAAKKHIFSVVLLTAVAFIIYSNTFDASFHFDDTASIVENYAIHRFDIKQIFSGGARPVLDLTFALNYYFGKLDVFGYHLVNLLLHIANSVMLYFILLLTVNAGSRAQTAKRNEQGEEGTTGVPASEDVSARDYESGAESSFNRIPLYASLIFIAHPVQTQAVTYIVSRSAVLATFFYLLALLLFIKGCRAKNEEQRADRKRLDALRPALYFSGGFIASCLGMGSKQIAVTIPFMLLLYDFYFISEGRLTTLKKHFKIHLVMFVPIVIGVYFSFSGIQKFVSFDYAKGIQMPQGEPVTSLEYFLTQLHVIPYYIKLLFIPTNLNLDYDWPLTRHMDFLTAACLLFLGSLVWLAIRLFRRNRLVSFGIMWFFLTLTVESSFLVIYDVIFEHRMYLPSIGFAVIMAFMIHKISDMKIDLWSRSIKGKLFEKA